MGPLDRRKVLLYFWKLHVPSPRPCLKCFNGLLSNRETEQRVASCWVEWGIKLHLFFCCLNSVVFSCPFRFLYTEWYSCLLQMHVECCWWYSCQEVLRNTSFDHQAINTLFSASRLASHYLLSHIASRCGNTTRFVIILFYMLLCLWIFNQHCCNRLPSVSSTLFKGGFFLIRLHQSHNAHSPTSPSPQQDKKCWKQQSSGFVRVTFSIAETGKT